MKFGSVGSHNGNNKLTRLFYNYISLHNYHIKMIFYNFINIYRKNKKPFVSHVSKEKSANLFSI